MFFDYKSDKDFLLSDIDKVALVERHLISETLAAKEDATAAMISDDEVVSIMFFPHTI